MLNYGCDTGYDATSYTGSLLGAGGVSRKEPGHEVGYDVGAQYPRVRNSMMFL